MGLTLPRILYLLGAAAWGLLFWRNPVTVFMAACLSCLSLPLYRGLQARACARRRLRGAGRSHSRLPLLGYVATLLACLLTPVAALVLLVSPQAAAGFARLKELQANNFQVPPEWVANAQQWKMRLADYPRLTAMLDDFQTKLAALFEDAMDLLFTRGAEFLGGTMTVLWTACLFLALTVLFTLYARHIRIVAGRILRIPQGMLGRFTAAIHRALKAILLGVVLVAAIQGVLCGLAFAVAGVRQPAFWGLLATLVAPIPAVGTALVWGPLCLSLWFTGKTVAAVGLALWGAIVVAGIDNVLRPLFLRQGIKASFFVLIIAILCGLANFGATGLIAGPVLLAFALQAVEEGHRYFRHES